MLPEHVASKIVMSCRDAVHQPQKGSPNASIIHNNRQLYAFTHLRTTLPPHDVPAVPLACAQLQHLAVSTCHLLIPKAIYTICQPKDSAAQLCDRHCTTQYGGRVVTCLHRHHTTRHARPDTRCTLIVQAGCGTLHDLLRSSPSIKWPPQMTARPQCLLRHWLLPSSHAADMPLPCITDG